MRSGRRRCGSRTGARKRLIHAAAGRGIRGRALRLLGYGDEDETEIETTEGVA